MRSDWGDVYKFAVVNGRYAATAKFGSRECLYANDPEELRAMIWRHYRPERLQDRCST